MYKIMGKYKSLPAEEIDEAEDISNAEYLLGEYRLAYGCDWRVWYEKE